MKKYSNINEAFDPNAPSIIESTPRIVATKGEISKINIFIKNYINNVYGKFGYKYPGQNLDIHINKDLIIDCEFVNKMLNNYIIFKFICNINSLKTIEDFSFFMSKYSNLEKYYHYNGFYNKEILSILFNTIKKGRIGEKISLKFFERTFNKKSNQEIRIIEPTLDEDLKGVDGRFLFKGNEYTIQVKPFSDIIEDNESVKFLSVGSVSLSTHYLVLYRKTNNLFEFYILNSNFVTIQDNFFVYPIDKKMETGSELSK